MVPSTGHCKSVKRSRRSKRRVSPACCLPQLAACAAVLSSCSPDFGNRFSDPVPLSPKQIPWLWCAECAAWDCRNWQAEALLQGVIQSSSARSSERHWTVQNPQSYLNNTLQGDQTLAGGVTDGRGIRHLVARVASQASVGLRKLGSTELFFPRSYPTTTPPSRRSW